MAHLQGPWSSAARHAGNGCGAHSPVQSVHIVGAHAVERLAHGLGPAQSLTSPSPDPTSRSRAPVASKLASMASSAAVSESAALITSTMGSSIDAPTVPLWAEEVTVRRTSLTHALSAPSGGCMGRRFLLRTSAGLKPSGASSPSRPWAPTWRRGARPSRPPASATARAAAPPGLHCHTWIAQPRTAPRGEGGSPPPGRLESTQQQQSVEC